MLLWGGEGLENTNSEVFSLDAPLDWILQLNSNNSDPQQSVSNLLKSVQAHENENDAGGSEWLGDCDRLQPMLRNFCFTSVQCDSSRNKLHVSKQQRQEYTFHGYFLANRSVHAVIRMVISLEQQQQQQQQQQ